MSSKDRILDYGLLIDVMVSGGTVVYGFIFGLTGGEASVGGFVGSVLSEHACKGAIKVRWEMGFDSGSRLRGGRRLEKDILKLRTKLAIIRGPV